MDERRRRHDANGEVMVVDARQQYVGHIHWAVARRALREKRVRMWRRHPPVVMLPIGEREVPSFKAAERQHVNTNVTNLNEMRGPAVMNWLKFFQDEKDIWVQNISATQLSMQFDVAPGQTAGVLIPIGSDPVCLTQEVPFESIKKSMDFRRFLNKVPSVMRLLTEEQVQQYYAERARQMGAFVPDPETGRPVPNVSAAIQQAELDRKALTTRSVGTDDSTYDPATGQFRFSPPKSAQELMNIAGQPHMGIAPGAVQAAGLAQVPQGYVNTPAFVQQAQAQAAQGGGAAGLPGGAGPFQAPGPISTGFAPQAALAPAQVPAGFSNVGEQPILMEQVIHPRVLNLCQQVSTQLPENMRMPAGQLFRELQQLAPILKLDDLQYIESHGTYKTVKKWAKELYTERVQQEQGEGLEDGLEPAAAPVVHI